VVVTVIALLAALAVGAYNRVVGDAKRAKSSALVNMLVTAKSMFAADPKTTSTVISAYNSDPDYVSIAPYVRVNGVATYGRGRFTSQVRHAVHGVDNVGDHR
jgi:Tfp pilus assembly protein PilE